MYLVHTLNTKVGFTFTEDKILMNVTTKENSGKCVKYQKIKTSKILFRYSDDLKFKYINYG